MYEVTKNSCGVLLTVPVGDFLKTFNSLNEQIIGWEIVKQVKVVA